MMVLMSSFVVDDGGRAAAGFTGEARDCVARALAIATGIGYQQSYDDVNALIAAQRKSKLRDQSHARTGVHTPFIHKLMTGIGWSWTPTMGIGTGCTVHLRADELPSGTLIVNLSKHVAVVIDGVIYDTHDPSRGGTRCVYGYWQPDSVRVAQ